MTSFLGCGYLNSNDEFDKQGLVARHFLANINSVLLPPVSIFSNTYVLDQKKGRTELNQSVDYTYKIMQ